MMRFQRRSAGEFERRNLLHRTKTIWLDQFSEPNWVSRLYSPDVRSREIKLVSYSIIFFKQKLIFDFHEISYAEDASINEPKSPVKILKTLTIRKPCDFVERSFNSIFFEISKKLT